MKKVKYFDLNWNECSTDSTLTTDSPTDSLSLSGLLLAYPQEFTSTYMQIQGYRYMQIQLYQIDTCNTVVLHLPELAAVSMLGFAR